MEPSEDQIRELMATVACAVCGAQYDQSNVQVLGHREALWFMRVSCNGCSTCGLVAALVKVGEADGTELPANATQDDAYLDRARAPGRISRADVAEMRDFLDTFDGDFWTLFGPRPDEHSQRPAA